MGLIGIKKKKNKIRPSSVMWERVIPAGPHQGYVGGSAGTQGRGFLTVLGERHGIFSGPVHEGYRMF